MLHIPRPKTSFKARPTRGAVVQISCEAAKCLNHLNGWNTILEIASHLDTIEWVRRGNTHRRFTEKAVGQGLIEFRFEAGQECFTKHYQQDMMFDIARVEDRRVIFYPDGDAFVEDSDKHLRKIKEVIDG